MTKLQKMWVSHSPIHSTQLSPLDDTSVYLSPSSTQEATFQPDLRLYQSKLGCLTSLKSWWCGVNVSQATAIGQLQAGAIKMRANWRAPSTTRFWRVLVFHVFIPELGPMTVFVNEAMKILVYFPNLCQHVPTQQCATSAIFWHILLDIHNFSAID